MAWFDLGGEKIVAIHGMPMHCDAPCKMPFEKTALSAEAYAEQLLSRIACRQAAEDLGPLVSAELVAVDPEN